MKFFYTNIFMLLFALTVSAQPYTPGETYFGDNDYIEYKAGNLPIIISAPHGGTLTPNNIPDRDCSGCVYVRDAFTDELALDMYNAIFEEFGCYPHVIINNLHRRKLDANRSLIEAADGNPIAGQAWMEFQDFIESAKDSVEAQFGKGLFLDLHGHGHEIQRLELGYLITRSELQLDDDELNTPLYINETSIKNLVSDNLNGYDFIELIRGDYSLGQYYEVATYPSVPSETDQAPFGNEPFFSGGYNTRRHGSRAGGHIDGIQIECNMEGVRNNMINRVAFAESTASVLKSYLERHYFGEGAFNGGVCNPVVSVPTNETLSALHLSPNPVQEVLYLNFQPALQAKVHISLVNQLGQLVLQKECNASVQPVKLSVEEVPSGLYFLRVDGEQVGLTRPVVIR